MSSTIQHSAIVEGDRHPPRRHDLASDRHNVPSGSTGMLLSSNGSQPVYLTLASFLSQPPSDHDSADGSIWYDDTNHRFLCRRGGETHVIVTRKED